MAETPQIITGKVTKNIDVLIKSIRDNNALDAPLYAINWFSTKREWVYHFYNFLAYPRVKSVGGKVFFKGKVTETLQGVSADARDLLLIVNYPSGKNFRNLMVDTLFKMVSIFRIMAVKNFSFGFTQKLFPTEKQVIWDKTKKYAIHHFKTNDITAKLVDELEEIVQDSNVQLHYAGAINALLYSKQNDQRETQIPCLMDGILLLESETVYSIKRLINQPAYQTFSSKFESSFIGLIQRTR